MDDPSIIFAFLYQEKTKMNFVVICFLLLSTPFLLSAPIAAFNYYQLVQQWPFSYCDGNSGCKNPIPRNFTIHGLWPSDSTTTSKQPASCIFDRALMTPSLNNELKKDWPDLKGDHESFWRYQWKKHGTCSSKNLGQAQYFRTSLTLKNQVYLLEILEKSNLKPIASGFHPSRKISDVIEKNLGVKPRLWCEGGLLLEISICVESDDDGTATRFFPCPEILLKSYRSRQCPKDVKFPIW